MKRSRAGKAKAAGKGPQAVEPLAGEEAQRLRALIESAEGVHTLGGEELLRALKADRPCDSKSCKGKTGNPNCLCNLVPAPESFRKAGLWARQADVVGTLGTDPADAQRKDLSKPVGLKNLGNTCYVNSVLQCLFANQAFRRAVYALRQPLADEPIVKELRELFLAMEHGCRDPVDPAPLARALNLDHAVQQDGQEFMKLFLTLLEARFSQQEELRDIIQALFRGQSGYLTLCQTCCKQSESSARSDNFYEVDVPVKGHRSLQESLNSLLNPEWMEGDNAYFCEHCQTKVTATRQLELRQLPPVLCFSLQRFVFDFQRMDRVKVSDKFAFPLTLDMGPIINQAQRKDLVYDLEAIMVHKGGSAMQGHYVAHIKMEPAAGGATGNAAAAAPEAAAPEAEAAAAAPEAAAKGAGGKRRGGKKAAAAAEKAAAAASDAGGAGAGGAAASGWWRFDDAAVTELKGGPTANGDHGGGAKPAASGAASAATGAGGKKKGGGGRGGGRGGKGGRGGRGGGRKKRGGGGDESDPDYAEESAATVGDQEDADLAAAMAASLADAAPGAAAAVAEAAGGAPAEDGAEAGAAAAAAEEIVSSNAYLLVYRRRGEALPLVALDAEQEAELAAARDSLVSEQQQAVAAYAEDKQRLVERQAARQTEVRTIMDAATRLEEGDLGCFVPLAWLDGWANGGVEAAPDPVDNSQLLCPHNKLDPAKVPTARRISTQAWQGLQESCRGGPQLSPADACPICLAAQLDAISAQEDTQAQMDRYAAMADALAKGEGPAQGLSEDFYISSTWLQGWTKRKDKKNMSDKSPTAEITCACGRLAPESGGKGKKRVAVPADFYRFLQRGWTAHCAAQRAKQARSKSTATGGGSGAAAGGSGGGSGVWEAGGEGEDVEVICLDSPTAVGAGQAAAAAAAAEAKEEGGEAEAKRPRRRGRAAAAQQGDGEQQQGQQQQPKAEPKQEADVVMLDADDSSDEPVDVTEAAAAEAAAGKAGGAQPAADTMLDFPVDTPACPTCTVHLQEAKRVLSGMKDRMDSEKRDLAGLVAPQQPPELQAGATYHLVPRAFMDQWRAYMHQAGKRVLGSTTKADQIVRPPSLAEAMLGVLCECHRPATASGGDSEVEEEGGNGSGTEYMLAYPPPAVLNRRGRWVLASSEAPAATAEADGPYELVSAEHWQLLSMYYGPDSEEGGGGRKRGRKQPLGDQLAGLLERGIAATLVVDTPPGAAADGSPGAAGGEQPAAAAAANGVAAAALPPQRGRPQRGRAAALVAEATAAAADSGSDVDLLDELTIGSEQNPYKLNRRPNVRSGAQGSAHFETDPQVCSAAVAEREAALRAARLTYTGEQVMVELVQSAEEAVAAGEPGGGAERKSKRARKGRAPVTVDSNHTLQIFRNLIFQELGVHPRNAQLFLRGAPLAQEETATLAECEVFPGDEVKVVDSGEHDSTDFSSLFPVDGKGGRRRREAERGFTGTALTGLVPAAAGAEGEDGEAKQEGGGSELEGQQGGIDVDAELAAAAAGEAMEG